MERALRHLFYFGPLLFAFGFLVPLIAQLIIAIGLPLPDRVSPLLAGLILGGGYGLLAQWKGRWV